DTSPALWWGARCVAKPVEVLFEKLAGGNRRALCRARIASRLHPNALSVAPITTSLRCDHRSARPGGLDGFPRVGDMKTPPRGARPQVNSRFALTQTQQENKRFPSPLRPSFPVPVSRSRSRSYAFGSASVAMGLTSKFEVTLWLPSRPTTGMQKSTVDLSHVVRLEGNQWETKKRALCKGATFHVIAVLEKIDSSSANHFSILLPSDHEPPTPIKREPRSFGSHLKRKMVLDGTGHINNQLGSSSSAESSSTLPAAHQVPRHLMVVLDRNGHINIQLGSSSSAESSSTLPAADQYPAI
ncbi:MAG: hypothetical protein BJ554DRAFT_220, partial [Olpidium bornovanus]